MQCELSRDFNCEAIHYFLQYFNKNLTKRIEPQELLN